MKLVNILIKAPSGLKIYFIKRFYDGPPYNTKIVKTWAKWRGTLEEYNKIKETLS